ncbi:MAG: formate dehydrogenase accessory sulfurtransferase FdhD [candidate division Zixibacteria bacterium]|nr:formate dehydrogenase accessory sulfurtransferase FdhD [candidate division Zixibacteria bacterium]
MDKPKKHLEALKYVRANRISTVDAAKPPEGEDVCVIKEAAVTIDVDNVETYTLLCTPTDSQALAAGFLFSEGVIDGMQDVSVLRRCNDDPNIIRIRLSGQVPRSDDTDRNLLIVSSCGACGSKSLSERIRALPAVGETLRIETGLLRSVHNVLSEKQCLFKASGGTHGAAVFDHNGTILAWAEDIGRHNALDKAIGKCLLANIPVAGRGVTLTSRLSLEMVLKCARAGIEMITAVSAPTSMAIDVALTCGITLCAFVRDTRATVFAHPGRVIGMGK